MQSLDDLDDMLHSEEDVRLRKEAIAWVIRLQNTGISEEDRRAFDAWQAQSPQHARLYRKVSEVWESPELRAAAAIAAGLDLSWSKAEAASSL